jgi:hypothetical protein
MRHQRGARQFRDAWPRGALFRQSADAMLTVPAQIAEAAKTSSADVLQTLACLGIADRHISADAKSVARISQKISMPIWRMKPNRR